MTRLPIDDPAWRGFVAGHPAAGPLHQPEWASFLAECYGFRTFAFVVTDGNGITAGIPVVEVRDPVRGRRWISLPFSDECEVLAAGAGPRSELVQALEHARVESNVRRLEVRSAVDGGVQRVVGFTHRLRLPTEPGLLHSSLPSNTRYSLRLAERSGVVVRRADREEDLTETFYRLHVATRQRLGVPVQPRRYFSLLWKRLIADGLGVVLVAQVDDVALAAGVFLNANGHVLYKYGAADFAQRKLNANSALLDHAIREAIENGETVFDWGRTSSEDEGLRRFKASWGSDERELSYTSFGAVPTERSGGGLSRLARSVIRSAPSQVCRLVGAALYRYAA